MSDQNRETSHDNQQNYVANTIKEHEFDGIQEFDNKLPNWWLWIMYGSIVFAVVYWVVIHTLETRPLSQEKFAIEQLAFQEAELARMAEGGITDEVILAMAALPDKLDEGKAIFKQNCVACHLEQGQGIVGPNLTDGVWVHGCGPKEIFDFVMAGNTEKGMPAWNNTLGPNRVQAVVAYVTTLKNTNIEGKAPEGVPCD